MNIGYDFGHGVSGDRGAVGILAEEKVIREYGELVIKALQVQGHKLFNLTPPSNLNLTLAQSLAYRVNKANYYELDLIISLHANDFEKESANGCEVFYISAKGKALAEKITNEISKLGFYNRGAKYRENLYVLKYTKAPAVLVEPFFISNKNDCSRYNPTTIASAIVKAITGKGIIEEKVPENKTDIDHSVPDYAGVIPLEGGLGYIQVIKDRGRIDIHLDRFNYITIQDSKKEGNNIILTTRTKGSKILL